MVVLLYEVLDELGIKKPLLKMDEKELRKTAQSLKHGFAKHRPHFSPDTRSRN